MVLNVGRRTIGMVVGFGERGAAVSEEQISPPRRPLPAWATST